MNEISVYTFFEFKKTESAGNFITNSRVYSLLITQAKTDGGVLANRNSANHPNCFLSNQKKVQILAFFACDL